MTLLDPKHLLAPFKNTVHLIAIVFIVLLFAVYRLATGGVEIVDRAETTALPSRTPSADQPQPSESIFAAPAVGGLNNQLAGVAGSNDSKAKATAAPSENADLKEIEKALGIAK